MRNAMVADSMERLHELARRAVTVQKLRNDEFVVVCIQVNSLWRDLVDSLMPGADWQQYRNRGEEPIARGTATFGVVEDVASRVPNIANVVLAKPAAGMAKLPALSEGGCTVYDIPLTHI